MPLHLPTGVLLVNLGTPDAPTPRAVRRYLREFLSDPRVIDIPALPRWLLVNGAILPFRPRASARAYRAVWTDAGSPLLVHSQALADGVAAVLGAGFRVELAMRYGQPSIPGALARLESEGIGRLVVVPLFPQYSSAATGSAVARVFEVLAGAEVVPPVAVAGPFYDDPVFIEAAAEVARPALADFRPDHVLMSFHGLPERQIRKADPSGRHCLASDTCCAEVSGRNAGCYRAHCFATARALASALEVPDERTSVAFQSRLGRTPWIQPFTDERLPELAAAGVKRLAILCPAFVADCLETVEEIGIRARDQWSALGGDALLQVPCPNAHPTWIRAVADLVRREVSAAA
ncbi:MAG: ferrochelatase [Proteobacteria bacterium]|nr:ferrochelatase [Pseudomonadota bacterium]